jgi:hypothetical protein
VEGTQRLQKQYVVLKVTIHMSLCKVKLNTGDAIVVQDGEVVGGHRALRLHEVDARFALEDHAVGTLHANLAAVVDVRAVVVPDDQLAGRVGRHREGSACALFSCEQRLVKNKVILHFYHVKNLCQICVVFTLAFHDVSAFDLPRALPQAGVLDGSRLSVISFVTLQTLVPAK